MKLFLNATSIFFKCFFRIFYRLSITGTDNPYQGSAIIAPNHSSFLDPPLIGIAWPEETHFIARASLFRNRIWKKIQEALNSHPVSGTAQDVGSFRKICQLLREGNKVVIFPEGARSATGEMLEMKSGVAMLAIRMQCPIIPVYIKGTYEAWPKHKRWPKFRSSIACAFGQPIYPPNASGMNKKEIQNYLIEQIQSQLEELKRSLGDN